METRSRGVPKGIETSDTSHTSLFNPLRFSKVGYAYLEAWMGEGGAGWSYPLG